MNQVNLRPCPGVVYGQKQQEAHGTALMDLQNRLLLVDTEAE